MKPYSVIRGSCGWVVAALGLCGFAAPIELSAQDLSTGLIAFYPFTGNTNDQSGNSHSLQVTGAVLASDRFGQPSRAISFSDRLSTASTGVSLAGTSFSIGGWFYQDRRDPLAAPGFAQGDVGQPGLAFRLMLDYDTTSAKFTFWFNDLNAHFVRDYSKWIHLMGSFDQTTRRRKLYINGVIVAQDTAAVGFSGTGPLRFGFFAGLMDEVVAYNRALSDSEVQRLHAGETPQPAPSRPIITSQSGIRTMVEGDSTSFSVTASGTAPFSYQWTKDGGNIPAATTATLTLNAIRMEDAGSYAVTVTNVAGSVSSSSSTLVVRAGNPGRLSYLSIRTTAGGTNGTVIVGFVLGGEGVPSVSSLLIRGSGPALAQFGVAGILPDPVLTLYEGGRLLASNNDWDGSQGLIAVSGSVGAFPFLSGSKDAVLFSSLGASAYSAQVFDAATGSGIALVELYDAEPSFAYTRARLKNVSARATVGTGGGIMIAGFAIKGTTPLTVLVRGIGPALSQFGVGGVLANPRMTLYRDSVLATTNDNWGEVGASTIVTAAASVAAFPLAANSLDSAILATLQPGSYTVQLAGVGETSGVGLIEVYEVP